MTANRHKPHPHAQTKIVAEMAASGEEIFCQGPTAAELMGF